MLSDLQRLTARVASTPVAFVARRFHQNRTGAAAVLFVEVTRQASIFDRQRLIRGLRLAASDDQIEAVSIRFVEPPGGRAALQDLRAAIAALRAAGKATYARLEVADNALLWLASACDQVFLVPSGMVAWVGVGAELTFIGAALERIGVVPEVEAAGAYKSAGEMFTRSYASPANLAATEGLIDDFHQQMVDDVQRDRNLSDEQVASILAEAPHRAEEAVGLGLVDRLLYDDAFEDWLEETHGKKTKQVPFADWWGRAERLAWLETIGRDERKIVVLHLQGSICVEDKSSRRRIRAHTVVPMLDDLRKDEEVGAVVLHIDSPGGGVLASDLIWRAVERLAEEKPVVASYEDVSASGGVYLSSPAHEVLARPATLTGSVGVVLLKPFVGDALRRVGIHTQPVTAAPNAVMSLAQRFSGAQRERIRDNIDRTYDDFVGRVAKGRSVDVETIEPFCRGRVWSGRAGLERKLVDRLGDLSDAVERARHLAGLTPRAVRVDQDAQPQPGWLAQQVREQLGGLPMGASMQVFTRLFQGVMGERMLDRLDLVLEHQGQMLAVLPFEIE